MIEATFITSREVVQRVHDFHGHMCPGLAVGIRAAEVALREVGPHAEDEEIVCVVETDMCAVDAIQYLTGCTFGKGNLIHLDYGKNAFTFYRRSDGKGLRLVTKAGGFGPASEERSALLKKLRRGSITPEERKRYWELQEERSRWVLAAPLDTLFDVKEAPTPLPRPARLHESLVCEACEEPVMETRIRRFEGKHYCPPCFEARALRYWPWPKGRAGC